MRREFAIIGQHDVASALIQTPSSVESQKKLPDSGDRRHALWERQIHVCLGILVSKGHMRVDEMRRCIEQLDPDIYKCGAYYQKWAVAIATTLLERGVLSNQELDSEFAREDDESVKLFEVGAIVRVRPSTYASRWRKPHLRTPGFIHGLCGVVEKYIGDFPNPEQLAFGGSAWTKQPLYLVSFDAQVICDYEIDTSDCVTVEVYHNWLELSTQEEMNVQKENRKMPACKRARIHNHNESCNNHLHETREEVELRAVEQEIPCPQIAGVLIRALLKKGIIEASELAAAIEKVDAMDTRRGEVGRRVIARAWTDADFKSRLLSDGNSACAELGIQASNATAPTKLVVFEQKPLEHHLVVCTLCSCYPLALLGLSPDWYKSKEYRARAIREPREVLREFGTELPSDVKVIVHDSTADCRYLILPRRPKNTEAWTENQLQELITRDSMIGIRALPETAPS